MVVREPAVVAYLVDVFDRSWERARPFTSRDTSLLKDIASEQRAMTMRMLIEGHADPVSAKRLGVSPRTYAGYVADLKTEYEAETRFQLGYTMGRMGVSGQEVESTRTSLVSPRSFDASSLLSRARRLRELLSAEICTRAAILWITALVLLRRAWGVRRWDRTSGGKVGSSSQICGWRQLSPSSVSLAGAGGRTGSPWPSAGAAAPSRPMVTAVADRTMAIRRAKVFMVSPNLDCQRPTEWPL